MKPITNPVKRVKKGERKRIKIEWQTQYMHGVKIVFKDWVPKGFFVSVTSPDEHGLQEVHITKL